VPGGLQLGARWCAGSPGVFITAAKQAADRSGGPSSGMLLRHSTLDAAILPTTYHAQDSRYCSAGDIPSHPSPGWPRLPLHCIHPRPLKHCPTSNPRPRPIRIPCSRAFLAYNVYASSRTKADRRPSRYIPRSLASCRSLEARILRIPYPASAALRRMTVAYHHMPTSAASAQWEKLLHGR
jgi:hypothetical protein